MKWNVSITSKAKKQQSKLPKRVRETLFALVKATEKVGPVRGDWPDYSKLSGGKHHCHLKKKKPTYVAVWREDKDRIQVVEVIYAGTHKKTPH